MFEKECLNLVVKSSIVFCTYDLKTRACINKVKETQFHFLTAQQISIYLLSIDANIFLTSC